MNKSDKLQQRKTALLEKLKELEKAEAKVASAAKTARKKQDDRVKLLLGVLAMQHLTANPETKEAFARQANKLSANERKFLASAQLWKELGMRPPHQEAQEDANHSTTVQSIAVPTNASSATSTQATERIAQANTPLRVPFAEKEEAKVAGAKFDTDARHWYVPTGCDLTRFAKWL
jgi:precorrin-6x reductase